MADGQIIVDGGKDVNGNMVRTAASLLDVAQINMTDVEEYRFENLPAGVYHWRVKTAGLEVIETTDKDTKEKIDRGVAIVELEVVNCLSLTDPSINPGDQIGRDQRSAFFLSDLKKGLGRLKAMMSDGGFAAVGALNEVLNAYQGFEFVSNIKITKDRNDPDREFANVDKVKPLASGAVPGAVVQPAAVAPVQPVAAAPVQPAAAIPPQPVAPAGAINLMGASQ